MSAIVHLAPTAPADEVHAVLARDGALIVDDLAAAPWTLGRLG